MSTIYVRPGHLHTASRVLSASSEAGLVAAPATPAAGNKGTLRLRVSGTPSTVAALTVTLQTGGNPSGYSLATIAGRGRGAGVIWRKTSDASSSSRGYIDTPYLVRVDYPIAYGTGLGRPSTPRTLANGNLGFVTEGSPGTASSLKFTSITTANVATTVDVDAAALVSDFQSDLVVLPSGRLLVFRIYASALTRYVSEDNGATWSTAVSCGSVSVGQDTVSVEYTEDLLTMVISSSTAAAVTDVRVSQDEGYNWTSVDATQTLRGVRTCVTSAGQILAIAVAAAPLVRVISPGGGLASATVDSELTCNTGRVAIATRDDGVVWAFATNSTAGSHVDLDASCSLDGGVTWSNPLGGLKVLNGNTTITNGAFRAISAGSWAGRIVVLALSRSSGGAGASDYAIHLYTLGGWESVTEAGVTGFGTVYTYDHVLLPVDIPTNFVTPWPRTDVGAGATVTNEGPYRFVSTAALASYFQAPTAVLAASNPGGSYRLRYRCRQVSGGALGGAGAESNGFRFFISDGAGNVQGFTIRMSTTQFRITDSAFAALSTESLDMTKATDFLFAFKHDNIPGTSGLLSYWYKQDADEVWTLGAAAITVPSSVLPGNSQLRVGGTIAVAGTHECYWLGVSDSSNTMEGGFTNPDDLNGRSLGPVDYDLTGGLRLGGYNAGGVTGDSYSVGTTYTYGKECIWRELRPSKKVHSASDNVSWNVVFDAGATEVFKGDTVALFGTNFRTASLQLNSLDSWGAPAITIALDATLDTRTIGAGNRGPGYVGPTSSPSWRPGQFKSDGDAHRYFLEVSGSVYEIADNDEDRIYVVGQDFSAAAGTMYIFGDKMATKASFMLYRFMRLLVGAQQTPLGDDCYHVGTMVFDRSFTPAQSYDHGFVDRIEPRVEMMETDAGYRSTARLGPRRHTLAIQWPPIAYGGPAFDLERRLASFYAALEGSHTPFVFWRDTNDPSTVGLYRLVGMYQGTNVWGEGTTATTRVDQLILEECY